MPRIRTALVAVASIAVLAPALASARTHNPRVTGTLHNSTCPAICIGHNDLADDIRGTHVWCAWTGDHVRVHIGLFNSSSHDLEVKIQPTYYVRNHGRHGSSHSSRKSVRLSAHTRLNWYGDAGRPEGVVAGTPLASCEPALKDVTRT